MSHEAQMKLLATALAALMLVGCGGKEERKAKYLERGKAYIADQNWDKARVEIKNVLQIDPKSAEAFYLMGQVEEKKQEWLKAFGNYTKASELDPELLDARVRLAQLYILQANHLKSRNDRDGEAKALGQAQTEIDEILKRDDKHSGALTLLASMKLREGNESDAMSLAEEVVAADPSYGPAAALLASMYEKLGRNTDAEKLLAAAAKTAEEPIALKFQLAQLYAREKKSEAAEAALREIIAERPDELSYRIQLAQYLAQLDRLDKAKAVLVEAIAVDPDDPQRYLLLVDLMIAKKETDAAKAYLEESIAKKPELYELRLGLARLYEQEQKLDEAKKVYESMISRYGDEPAGLAARNRLAGYAAAAGDLALARKYVGEVLAKNPKDNDALLLNGRMAMQESDFDAAVGAFRSVLKDQPDSVPVMHLLAEAQLRKGDIELAGDNLQRAVEVAPLNPDARIKYARYLIAKKDLARALEQLDAVLNADNSNADAIAARSEVLAAKGDIAAVKAELAKLIEAAPDKPEAKLRLARVYMAENDSSAAMSEVDSVLASNPSNVSAWIIKTDILAALRDNDALREAIEGLKSAAPKHPEGYFRMGRYLRASGDIAAAVQEYERGYALAQGEAKTAMLTEIINTQISAGMADQALARLDEILRDEPDNKTVGELIGVVHLARKDHAAAEIAFTKQIRANPKKTSAYLGLAAAREQQGDLDGTIAAFQQGLGILKDDISLQMGIAAAHERQKDYDSAIQVYESVLIKNPENLVAVNNLASLLVDHHSDEQSLRRAKQLAQKLEAVQQPAIRDTLGWVHYHAGEYDEAIQILEGVVNAMPDIGIFRYHLGMAYAKAGNKAKAKDHLSAALKQGDFPGVEEAKSTLNSL